MIEGLQPYLEYKESGLPWTGRLPKHWSVKRGKALFSESHLPVRAEDEIVTCFRDGQVTLRKNRRASGFMIALYEAGYQGVRRGHLVIHAMDAFAGAIGVSDSDGKCTPEYIVADSRSEIADPRYFAKLLRLAAHQGFILVSCPAVRERAPRFRYAHFGDMLMPLPPANEQAAIVRFLEHANRKIDGFIRAKRKLIGLLNEQKQAIIHRAVTRGLDPHAPLKPSGIPWLGDIPQHWEVRRMKSLSQVKRGASPRPIGDSKYFDANGTHAWVRIADVTASNRYLQRTKERLSELGRSKSVSLNPGAIFLSIAGSVGKPMITKIKCCIHDGFVYFPYYKGVPEFLSYLLSLGRVYEGLGKLGTQLNLNTDTVGNIRLPMPPQDEQSAIVTHLDASLVSFDTAIARTEREIALMQEYRTRLTADVVTGKLDVRPAAAKLPQDSVSESLPEDTLDDAEPEETEA
jgi:type I restriction enzyme S subunit